MLKISTRGQYALLIMTELAEQDPQKFTSLKQLSHRHKISQKYAEQILIQLSKFGLVTGMRGSNGGYKLSKNADSYKIGEILRIMEGELSAKGTANENIFSSTGIDFFWDGFDKTINDYADSITLEQLAQKNREFTGYDYVI